MGLRDRLLGIMLTREPDFIVGGVDNPYLLRWWVIPRNKVLNEYLHRFLRSDDDTAHHDHPWLFNLTIVLENEYTEHTIAAGGVSVATVRKAGQWKFRWGPAPHRIELHNGPCTTLFITGPVVREWGFHCPKGWVPWKIFTATVKGVSTTGRGCE
jgi:hypothetical protein